VGNKKSATYDTQVHWNDSKICSEIRFATLKIQVRVSPLILSA
jgi:hypothetical protein